MLKLLYKTLLISVISSSLITMNMTVMAEDTTPKNNVNAAIAPMSKSTDSGLTRDANGVLSKTENYKFEGSQAEDGPLSIIVMLAIGVIGTKLMMYKKWTLDMTVVAVASAAYIAAEILNLLSLGNELKTMTVKITKKSDGTIDQTQIETLQKLKESYEKAKKSGEIKKMLQMAAAAAYAVAAAIAAYQRLTEKGQQASCEAAILNAPATLGPCAAAGATGIGAAEAAGCSACQPLVAELGVQIKSDAIKKEIVAPSLPQGVAATATDPVLEAQTNAPCAGGTASAVKATITGACSTYLKTKKINSAFGEPTVLTTFNSNSLNKMLFSGVTLPANNISLDPTSGYKNMLQKMLDIFLPRAEAGMMAMLGLGAGAAAAFFTAKTAIGRKIDTFMFTPGGRIIAWGVLAAAALMGASATQKEIDKLDAYIKKIDQILKDLNTLALGVKANNVNEQQIKLASFNNFNGTNLQLNPNVKVKTDCISSMGSSNCTPLADQFKGMPEFVGLPDSLQSVVSQSAKLGDGLSGVNSISGSTLTSASSLAGKLNAIGKLNKSLRDKLNSGAQKIDFDKQGQDLWAQLKSQTAKVLKSKNMSASGFLASAGMSSSTDAGGVVANLQNSLLKNSIKSGTAGTTATPVTPKEKGMDLNFKEVPSESAGAVVKVDKFDIGANDINTNSGDSLFQLISNRYIKSGYPKLLEEIPAKN